LNILFEALAVSTCAQTRCTVANMSFCFIFVTTVAASIAVDAVFKGNGMKNVLKLIYQPYKWLILLPLFFVVTIVAATLAVLFSTLVSQRLGSLIGGSYWSRVMGLITPMRVKVFGRKNIDKKQSYIIVSNHQSAYDIFTLYGWLGIDFRYIMKKELRKMFAIGYASEKVGHIFIDRSSPKAAYKSLEEAKRKLVNGTSVVIFPEGTRTGSNQLSTFKRGAFKMAFDLNLPILPVTLVDTHKIMGKGFFNVMPGKAKLVIHQPIDITQYVHNDEALVALVREKIQSGFAIAK
jgi:1-acyl-sn-glycerol-3-phosphate acyltransferase